MSNVPAVRGELFAAAILGPSIQGVPQNVLNILRGYGGMQIQKCNIGCICIACKGLDIGVIKAQKMFTRTTTQKSIYYLEFSIR